MKHISEETSETAILEGPDGVNWSVGLEKTIDGTFLSIGWSSFIKGHDLKEHDFLVFEYDGDMHFSVLLFDTTACEKEEQIKAKADVSGVSEVKRKRGRPAKRSLNFDLPPKEEIKGELDKLPTTGNWLSSLSEASYRLCERFLFIVVRLLIWVLDDCMICKRCCRIRIQLLNLIDFSDIAWITSACLGL